jgi:hypothetical protein
MKKYIKPEVKVYRTHVESLLAAESGGQFTEGDAKRHNNSLFDEEYDDSQTGKGSLWDYDWNNMR